MRGNKSDDNAFYIQITARSICKSLGNGNRLGFVRKQSNKESLDSGLGCAFYRISCGKRNRSVCRYGGKCARIEVEYVLILRPSYFSAVFKSLG